MASAAEMGRRGGVAIRIALSDPSGWARLEDYLEELDDQALTDLKNAADKTGDVASFILGRRHS